MSSVVSHAKAADGTELLVRSWSIDRADAAGKGSAGTTTLSPWASVLLVHGLGEHSGRYEHVGDQLTGAGLAVSAYDHRGMGGSGGRRGDLERWSLYHDDLAERLADIRLSAGDRPVVIYGHSLGGLIAAGYLLTPRPKSDLAVLSSPALDSALPRWKKAIARPLALVAPTAAIPNGVRGETLSRDPSVAAKTANDPFCVKTSTARFGASALAEQGRVRRLAPGGFGIPALVLHGEDDGLVPASASEILGGARGVERRTFPNLRHELHNEPEGPDIIESIIAWLREKTRGAVSVARSV
jgi:alpha-beta hydrolase superfamily lysophospholipase